MEHFSIYLCLAMVSMWAHAEENVVKLKIEREAAQLPVYVMAQPEAVATVILLPRGDAGSGKIVDGQPTCKDWATTTA